MSLPVLLFISLPEAMLVSVIGLSLLGFKSTLKEITLIGIFQAICSYFIRSLPIAFGIHSILQLITFSLIISFIYLIPYKLSFLAALLGLSIYLAVEMVSAPLIFNLTGLSLSSVLNNFWERLVFFLPEALILVIIILLIQRLNLRFPERWLDLLGANKSYILKSAPLISLFLLQFILIMLIYLAIYLENNSLSKIKTFISDPFMLILMDALISVLFIFSMKRIINLLQEEIKLKTQLDYLNQIEELVRTLRLQRHNFNHELQVIYGLLEVEAFREAKEYIKKYLEEIAVTSELIKTDKLEITALLQTKASLAESRKINFKVEVKTSLRDLPLEVRDFNVILGNLIDNAFEAVERLPSDQRKVEVELTKDLMGYVFIVRNYGLPIKQEVIEKIFEPGFSTKGEGRGMGLYSVKKLVQKYNGDIQVKSDANWTIFTVQLPDKIENTRTP
ncbi:sensor histidine kinase [Carboxydothermus islandicus]|nr:ATP-binding protein [Carboxydothermus islandicus]